MAYTCLPVLSPNGTNQLSTITVMLEPANRLTDIPGKCAIGVSLDLVSPKSSGALTVVIDVTIPPISSTLANRSYPSIPLITRTHLASAPSKFQGRASPRYTAESGVSSLSNNHRFALVPFTLDFLGGLGPSPFHTVSTHPLPQSPSPPVPSAAYNFSHAPAYIALSPLPHLPSTCVFMQINHGMPRTRTEALAPRSTPQQWAFQSLSHNICRALTHYVHSSLDDVSLFRSASCAAPTSCSAFCGSLPVPYARPSRTSLSCSFWPEFRVPVTGPGDSGPRAPERGSVPERDTTRGMHGSR
jgi:hypothetical protein